MTTITSPPYSPTTSSVALANILSHLHISKCCSNPDFHRNELQWNFLLTNHANLPSAVAANSSEIRLHNGVAATVVSQRCCSFICKRHCVNQNWKHGKIKKEAEVK